VSQRIERAISKGILASELALTGAAVAGVPGAVVGGVAGLIIGDSTTVFPLDMIAIPAYQAYMINGVPAMQIYIRAGETLLPTGGNVDDVAEGVSEAIAIVGTKKRTNKYTRFNKRFKFRAKRKSESAVAYMKARNKAVSRAWRKGGSK